LKSRIELHHSTYLYWRNKKILTKSLIGGAQEQESEKFSLPIFPCLILQPLSTWSYTGQTVLNYAKITDKSSAKLISFWTRTSTFERVFPRTKKLCIIVLVSETVFRMKKNSHVESGRTIWNCCCESVVDELRAHLQSLYDHFQFISSKVQKEYSQQSCSLHPLNCENHVW